MFEPNVFKLVIKNNFISSNVFALLIINVKILSNFHKEWCTFGRKKKILRKIRTIHSASLNVLNMQFFFGCVSNFKHINFAIDEKYFKNFYNNPNYYALPL